MCDAQFNQLQSKSGRVYTQPAKTSKKFSAVGGCKEAEPPLAEKFFGFW